MDDEDEPELQEAAFLQFFRVAAVFGALLGATLPSLFGLIVATAVGMVTPQEIVVSVGGNDLPIVFLAQAVFTIEILRETAKIMLDEEPEWRNIEE